MNDANWISDSLSHLETILQTADEFYEITQAAINKHKSQLFTNTTKATDPIPIRFGSNTVSITSFFSSVYFLDVKINIYTKQTLIKKDLQQHIQQFI